MRQFVIKQLLFTGMLCLSIAVYATPEIDAKIKELSAQITATSAKQIQALKQGKQISIDLKEKEKEKKSIEMSLKQWALKVRKLNMLSAEGDKQAESELNTVQFETKRAEFNLEKVKASIKQLQKDLNNVRKQKRILKSHVDTMHIELADLKDEKANPTKVKVVSQSELEKEALAAALKAEQADEAKRKAKTAQKKKSNTDAENRV